MPDADTFISLGPAFIQGLLGLGLLYQNSMKQGSISGPEFKRLGRELITLLREIEGVLEKASSTGPDIRAMSTWGFITSPEIEPKEKERLSAKIAELIEAIEDRSGQQ